MIVKLEDEKFKIQQEKKMKKLEDKKKMEQLIVKNNLQDKTLEEQRLEIEILKQELSNSIRTTSIMKQEDQMSDFI